MSVPEGQRGEGKFEVFVRTRELAAYTIKICCNKNIFLPEFQGAITDQIVRTANQIYLDCWEANGIKVTTGEDKEERKRLQSEAIRSCNSLLALVQLAQPVFHLKTKRVKYWGNMIINTRKLISSWKESDGKRYKEIK